MSTSAHAIKAKGLLVASVLFLVIAVLSSCSGPSPAPNPCLVAMSHIICTK